jgi:uncharacterized protein YhaN
MRLTSFALESYGNFSAVRLSLDPRPGHINLVVAPNGGGKSVLRQAFHDLLFGIPGQSKMAFRFGYAGMRLFAEGIDATGAAFAIGRRKGIGNTLIDGEGNNLDPHILKALIGEADEGLFERLFALDSHLLRRGAEAMLASGGDLAEALFAAGSGIAGLRRLRERFEALRDELAPERQTRSRPLYQSLAALSQARADLRTATIRPKDWQEASARLAFTRERRLSLAGEQADIQKELERLQRVKRVRPWLDQWQAARQEQAAAEAAPRLAPDTERRWREAGEAIRLAEFERKAATDRLHSLLTALAAEQPDDRLLAAGERIDGLARASDRIAADRRDLPPREGEHRQSAERLRELLQALGAEAAEEIAAIAPNGPQIAAARALVKRHGVLAEKLRNAEAEAAKTGHEIAAAEAEEARLGPRDEAEDVSGLAALVAEARADGDPARRSAELSAKLSREETRLAAALAKVPLWQRGLEALAAIVPPTRQMIDRAAAARDAAMGALAEAEREIGRLRGEREQAIERLAQERGGKPVPDAAAIAAARRHRDLGWSLVRRSKFEGPTPRDAVAWGPQEGALAAQIAAYAEPFGLAAAFERAIGEADHLADRRDEESRRLAGIAEQERRIAALDKGIAGAEPRLAAAREACEDAAHRWAALLSGLGFADSVAGNGAGMPEAAGLLEFLVARETALDARAARDLAQHALADEMARQEAMRRRLAELLPAEKCSSLAEALTAAQQVIERCAATRRERDQVETALRTFRRQQRQALFEREAAQKTFANWQIDWRECLAGLKRPPEETPTAVEKAIELIEAAHRERAKLAELEHRIAAMRGNIADFTARVADLVGAVAPDLLGQPPEIAAAELGRRLKTHRDIESRRAGLRDQEREAQAKLEEALGRYRRAGADREALRQEIGGAGEEEIVRRIALAERRRAAEAELRKVEEKLGEIGDGWPIDRLRSETAAVPPETVDAELARLQLDAERLSDEREEAAREEQRLSDELRRIGAGEHAINAEERRQAAIAALTRISAEALLYHAAACLLQRAVERLREAGDGGLVRRIGEVFTRITGGAYAGVTADEDDEGTPFLIAIEADRTTTKRVEQLSEGTRDQLFVALRLVMLEDYACKAPALPFIADDLLQTFDDYGRTANALAALADLATHVQVIVLSHQRQLIDVARALPAGTVNLCELAA